MNTDLPDAWPEEVEARHERWLSRQLGRLSSPRMLKNPEELRKSVAGKNVVITGGSSGLGAAIAKHCARAGANVIICARGADALAEVAARIRSEGGSAHAYQCDLADDAQVKRFATDVLRDHGHVDVLIHNAGKSMNRPIEFSYRRPKDLFATAGVNYLGPVRLTLLLLPYMRARGTGQIINISTAGLLLLPAPGWGFYLASKQAFDWWLRSIAPESRVDGVVVSQYYLGSVRTKMSAPDKTLHALPSQSADDAAWGVARAIVHKPRYAAHRPLFVVATATTALRDPIDRVLEQRVSRKKFSGNEFSSRAQPQEEFVMGDPHAFTRGLSETAASPERQA